MSHAIAIKVLLLTNKVSQADIVRATGKGHRRPVDKSVVSKVVAGRLTSGADATRAAKAIAKAVKQPVASLFPWAA